MLDIMRNLARNVEPGDVRTAGTKSRSPSARQPDAAGTRRTVRAVKAVVPNMDTGRQIIFIKWIGTHAECDKIDVKTVHYGS